MEIILVGPDKQTAAESLAKSNERLEEARAFAAAANEKMFEAILNNDPDEGSTDDRIAAAETIWQAEGDAEIAWLKYEKALIRYDWERAQAKKAGLI